MNAFASARPRGPDMPAKLPVQRKKAVLPVIQLQQAWRRKGELWKASCFIVRAPNRGYTTLSAAVPVHELFSEIGRALRVPFAALEAV